MSSPRRTPQKKQSWRRSGSRWPTVSARRSALNQWAPTFPVRTEPQCSTLKVFPKRKPVLSQAFVRRMTRMFTVRRATRPFTSKKARSSPSAAAGSWRFSTDYAFPGPFPFCARTGSQHFAGCHFLSAVCRDILVDTLPHISLSVVTFSPRCILLMVWTAVRK